VRVSRPLPEGVLRRALPALAFALSLAAPAAAAFQDTDSPRARLERARALSARREHEAAIVELDAALGDPGTAADPRLRGQIQMARAFAFTGTRAWTRMREDYEAAADAFNEAGAFRDEAMALRGLTFCPVLSWAEKERIAENAAHVLRRDPDPVVEGLVLHTWGDILVTLGRYGRGLEKLEQALGRLGAPSEQQARARVLTSIGRARRMHGQADSVLPYYQEALAIQDRIGDIRGAAQTENAIAVAYRFQWRIPEALVHSARAVALAERSGDASLLAFNRLQLGMFHSNAGDHRRAFALLAIADPALHPIDETSRLRALARAERGLGRTRAAMAHAEDAVARARTAADPYRIVFALDERAACHEALGRTGEALRDAQEAVGLLEGMRSGLAADDLARQGFADDYMGVFSSAIVLLVKSGRALEALEVAEQARARAFLDLLASRDLAPSAAERSRDAERRQLATAAPISGESMRATLARLDSTLLAYWTGATEIVAWVLAADGTIHARVLPLTTARIRALTLALEKGLPSPPGPEPARELYDLLVKPIAGWLPSGTGRRLTIVPHGPLFALPFAALKDTRGRYLVERWAPHYAASMSVLDHLEAQTARTGTDGILVVAEPTLDPRMAKRDGLGPLPAALAEAVAVQGRFDPGSGTVLRGAAATRAAAQQAAEGKRVLHFATHAVVSDTRPLESFLALAPADGDEGRLTSAEIYGWRLAADLVVLSACRTARGRVRGDGVIGLARAFAYAGTPSLVAAVWDAPDQTSRQLFPVFYAEWRRTGDRAGALRAAQIALIRRLRAGRISVSTPAGPVTLRERPALWAPFVLLGEP
jgi:CHAT domain-containing protein